MKPQTKKVVYGIAKLATGLVCASAATMVVSKVIKNNLPMESLQGKEILGAAIGTFVISNYVGAVMGQYVINQIEFVENVFKGQIKSEDVIDSTFTQS